MVSPDYIDESIPGERVPDISGEAVGRLGLPKHGPRVPLGDDASGLPVDADAPIKRRTPSTIAFAASNVLERLGVGCIDGTEKSVEEEMLEAWPEVAGPDLFDRLKPEKFVGGILYVLARNSTELFEIRRFKLRSLEQRAKRCAAFQGLRQVRVRVGS